MTDPINDHTPDPTLPIVPPPETPPASADAAAPATDAPKGP